MRNLPVSLRELCVLLRALDVYEKAGLMTKKELQSIETIKRRIDDTLRKNAPNEDS